MKKVLVFSCLLFSTLSLAETVVSLRFEPNLKYEESLFSCEHQAAPPFMFYFVGDVEKGKLTAAMISTSQSSVIVQQKLSDAELQGSAAELDYADEWWVPNSP